jgi:hypothetical protein
VTYPAIRTVVLISLLALAACTETASVPAAYVEGADYAPAIDPADFTAEITNPYLPWHPGDRWVYEGSAGASGETTVVEVLIETKVIMGVTCVVVRDEVSMDGQPVEITYDWYAQDADGNVWYFGEDSTTYADGQPSGTAGSWEAGVDGAQPGIVMLANPGTDVIGQAYRQEYLVGEAEDISKVIDVDQTAEVALGSYDRVVVTEDSTPLEPDVAAHKFYAPGIGLVMEEYVSGGDEIAKLIEFTPGVS